MNPDIHADKSTPRSKAKPHGTPKRPAAKKPAKKPVADDMSHLDPKIRRLGEALRRLYSAA